MMGTMERLRAGLAHLTARDREFAESLLSQAGGRGLSAKQSAWIDRLAARAAPPDPTEKPIVVAPIVAMFAKAYGTLKLPKVLVDADGTSLRLTVAGGRSRAPGSIVVTSAARSYDDRAFYGRIMQDGTVRFGRDVGSDVKRTIGAALVKLAEDPEGAARAYGQRLGQCCFCGLTLSDPSSIRVGYGPICAKHFSLPWGDRVAA